MKNFDHFLSCPVDLLALLKDGDYRKLAYDHSVMEAAILDRIAVLDAPCTVDADTRASELSALREILALLQKVA